MEPLKNLFNKVNITPRSRRGNTERGELLDQILSHVNGGRVREGYPPMRHGHLAHLLTGVPTKDIYALISKMDDGARRGVPPGAVFWTEIRPKKKP